jgi:hypothetical protein
MLGYIIFDKETINVEKHEIQSFDILHKTDLNIFVIKNDIINNACHYGHIQVLEWFKNSGYEFKYDKWAFYYASYYNHIQILKWFKNRNVKKVIKWTHHKFNNTFKYKTKNNYIKGYNKN